MLTGFILTDTKRLSSLLATTQYDVINALSSYITSCASYINWQLIDAADPMYDNMDKSDCHTYYSILNDYYYGVGVSGGYNIPLFIIGGDDIIPMPAITSPLSGVGSEYIGADMVYGFAPSEYVRLEDFVSTKPRFAVGRLPLTNDWNLDALNSYLNDCVRYMRHGICVNRAVMTTTRSWLKASKEMMRDIPNGPLSEDYVPLYEGMVVSPELDTEYKDMYDGYVHELRNADFWVCNLHGSSEPGVSYFIGEDTSHQKYVALQTTMLQETSPSIFNTVACFGGRFINYDICDSMLLSAFAHGTMLYCGASDVAYGGYDMEGNSELLMKLYMIYLHQGMPAGMALMKAKQDYYSTCHREDGDEYAMYTVLEFNLFGCPILSMQPKLSADYQPILLGNRVIEKRGSSTYNPKTMSPILNSAYQADDIHAYVQALVDGNIYYIRSVVEKEVYKRLGLPAANLQQIMRVSQNSYEMGYQFIYLRNNQESYRHFQMYYIVETDNQGDIKKIIHTK